MTINHFGYIILVLNDETGYEMNERIQKLAEQAFDKANNGTISDIKIPKEFIEKFAELIVRECIDWIDGSPTTEEGSLILSKHFIIANLKHHFGVEE